MMQKIINALPKCAEAGRDCKADVAGWNLPLANLFPTSQNYVAYTGSLTTLPAPRA